MNKLLIGIVVIIIGGAVGWYYFKGTGPKPNFTGTSAVAESTPTPGTGSQGDMTASGSTALQGNTVVTYTDAGFSPKSVAVKRGTTVTFKNESSGNMWVASGVHPTHRLLPGFDELTGVTKGGTYDYAFVKVGTWQYHNHLKPTDLAIVVVTE